MISECTFTNNGCRILYVISATGRRDREYDIYELNSRRDRSPEQIAKDTRIFPHKYTLHQFSHLLQLDVFWK